MKREAEEEVVVVVEESQERKQAALDPHLCNSASTGLRGSCRYGLYLPRYPCCLGTYCGSYRNCRGPENSESCAPFCFVSVFFP